MLFNSIHFLVFFPIVVLLYFSLPQKYRWGFLLAASYYFYMQWNWIYIFLIMSITLIDYFCAIWLEKATKYRKHILAFVLLTNLGLLFTFKYLGFAASSMQSLVNILGLPHIFPTINILLPVGISFFTLQAMAYFFDVYKGTRKAERHLGIFALFIAFFPQIMAGPIERSTNLLPQFFEKHKMNYNDVTAGLRIATWGFFKKIVVADRAALIVDYVYASPQGFSGWALIIATIAFAFQIYGDFSGYTDIAIGVGRIMGFRLMKNFNRPYAAKSVADFWRRWHISLSTWFKDYMYIPMGGSRVNMAKWARNVLVVFIVSGIWHGAEWTFVIWGALLGVWQLLERFSLPIREWFWKHWRGNGGRIRAFLAWLVTFGFISFTWIFFRANNRWDAMHIVRNLRIDLDWARLVSTIEMLGWESLAILTASIIAMEIGQMLLDRKPIKEWKTGARWTAYAVLVLWILVFAEHGSQEFIYFQF